MTSKHGLRTGLEAGAAPAKWAHVFILICGLIIVGCRIQPVRTPSGEHLSPTVTSAAFLSPTARTAAPQAFPTTNIVGTTPQASPEFTQLAATPSQSIEPSASPTPSLETATSTATIAPAPCDLAQDLLPAQISTRLPGEPFAHFWRLRNVGSCTWASNYAITWISGEVYASPVRIEIGASVSPGEVVELNVPMLAPEIIGDHLGVWTFVNPQGQRVDIVARADDLLTVMVRVRSNLTPSATLTTGSISGRLTYNGVPVQAGVAILLEDQYNNPLMVSTTNQSGRFTFNNVVVSDQSYTLVFSQELNPQYLIGQVVSWAWLEPILMANGELENLPDLEIAPLGFEQVSPPPNAAVSAGSISTTSPLWFEWRQYPLATFYWINLTRGDRQFSVWVSGFTSFTSIPFDGVLSDGVRIQSGDFWWGVGAQKPLSGYLLTVFSAMQPLVVTP